MQAHNFSPTLAAYMALRAEGEAPKAPDNAAVIAAATAAAVAATTPKAPSSGGGDGLVQRIDELTGKWRGEERAHTQTKTELELARAEITKLQKEKEGLVPKSELEKEAKKLAKSEAAQMEFDRTCNQVVAAGKKAFPKWDDTLANFTKIGGLDANLVAAAIEAGSGEENPIAATAAVLHELGGDITKAQEIMKLPTTKQVATLTRMAAKVADAKSRTSAAPEPIGGGERHINSKTERDTYDPELAKDAKAWMTQRNKELAAKRGAA